MDRFGQRKRAILSRVDASPKGSFDVQLHSLLTFVNSVPDLVSTSSCSGRVSVFLEGEKSLHQVGGKGGGKWLYISHESSLDGWWDQVCMYEEESLGSRMVLFKFEPVILHIRCRDMDTAGKLYAAAMDCGFRESGIGTNCVVGIRTSMRLDLPIAQLRDGKIRPLISGEYAGILTAMAEDLFDKNFSKIDRLEARIREVFA